MYMYIVLRLFAFVAGVYDCLVLNVQCLLPKHSSYSSHSPPHSTCSRCIQFFYVLKIRNLWCLVPPLSSIVLRCVNQSITSAVGAVLLFPVIEKFKAFTDDACESRSLSILSNLATPSLWLSIDGSRQVDIPCHRLLTHEQMMVF